MSYNLQTLRHQRSLRPGRFFPLLAIVYILVVAGNARGQYYNLHFRNFYSHEGLAQSEVESVYEDRRGFLWVGTHFGLTRFDGRNYRNYFHHVDDSTTMGDNVVMEIGEDRAGNIWLGLFNGVLSRLNLVSARFENFHPPSWISPTIRLETILVDHKDQVWMGTKEGLILFVPETKKFYGIRTDHTMPLGSILAIAEDSNRNIWLGTANRGLWRLDPGTMRLEQIAHEETIGAVYSIRLFDRNQFWIAAGRGLFELTESANGRLGVRRASFHPEEEALRDVLADRNGNIWIATLLDGLRIYYPATGFRDVLKENLLSVRGLLSNRLFTLYEDRRGGIWIGGEGGMQLFHSPSQHFSIYPAISNLAETLRGSTLYGIVLDDHDLILASSGGMIVFNRQTNRTLPIHYMPGYRPGSIRFRHIQREGSDRWWVTSDSGMFELIRQERHYSLKRPDILSRDSFFTSANIRMYQRSAPQTYWFATTDNGLFRYELRSGKRTRYAKEEGVAGSLTSNEINAIHFDRDSNLVVCHEQGLSIWIKDKGSFVHIRQRKQLDERGLNNPSVYDFHDDGQNYWIATYGGGLNKMSLTDSSFTYFTSHNGLGSDGLYTLIPVSDSIFWLGTTDGLSRFHKNTGSFENFGIAEGLPSDEFNMLSRFVSEDKEVFMGTINGLISFQSEGIYKDSTRPHIYLTGIKLGGFDLGDSAVHMANIEKRLVSRYNDDLILEFSPMMYKPWKQVSLRYNISEISAEWKTINNSALLPLVKLEPGEYTLQVQVFADNEALGSERMGLRIIVPPPIWKTTGFRLSLAASQAMLIFVLGRAYVKRRLEKQRLIFERANAIDKERARISGELHDDIGGGLTAIRLLSEMYKGRSGDKAGAQILSRISGFSNELIQKMNEIVWALNSHNDNLQSLLAYTRQYAVEYLEDLHIKSEVSQPDLIPDLPVRGTYRRNVFLLVKEALNNVAKHAHASRVRILFQIDNRLSIHICDDGRGFDPSRNYAASNGLKIMNKRIDEMKGNMQINQQEGTEIVFSIPLNELTATEPI